MGTADASQSSLPAAIVNRSRGRWWFNTVLILPAPLIPLFPPYLHCRPGLGAQGVSLLNPHSQQCDFTMLGLGGPSGLHPLPRPENRGSKRHRQDLAQLCPHSLGPPSPRTQVASARCSPSFPEQLSPCSTILSVRKCLPSSVILHWLQGACAWWLFSV